MSADHRSLIGEGLDQTAYLERSPVTAGFMAGLKAAIIGAPVGAGVQALRGKDAATGALMGAVGAAIIAALAKSGKQKLENLNTEAALRYHADNIKSREPLFFMPPRQYMGKYFSRRYGGP